MSSKKNNDVQLTPELKQGKDHNSFFTTFPIFLKALDREVAHDNKVYKFSYYEVESKGVAWNRELSSTHKWKRHKFSWRERLNCQE